MKKTTIFAILLCSMAFAQNNSLFDILFPPLPVPPGEYTLVTTYCDVDHPATVHDTLAATVSKWRNSVDGIFAVVTVSSVVRKFTIHIGRGDKIYMLGIPFTQDGPMTFRRQESGIIHTIQFIPKNK